MLASFLFKIKDHRRAQGRRYQLGHILLFSILAILSGADSYRKVQKFIGARYDRLDEIFNLNWKRTPAHTTIRSIIQKTSASDLEQSFREYSQRLAEGAGDTQYIGCDGKVLRGSFDHFNDQKAVQILSAFASDSHLILAHEEIAAKTNEIPTAQTLIEALGLTGYIYTFDALHCQKKRLKSPKKVATRRLSRSKRTKKHCSRIAST